MPKRQAQGSGTIRQRSDGRWEGRFTVGRDPGTGKQKQRSVYGWSQKEVLERMQHIQVEVSDGIYIEPSKLTVGQWANMWHDNFLGSVKPNTEAKYKSIIRTHIVPAFGKVKLSAITPPMIQQYYKKLLNSDPPYSPKSISLINGCLHKCFDKALKLGYIRVNPCDACELPRNKKASAWCFA